VGVDERGDEAAIGPRDVDQIDEAVVECDRAQHDAP
jgi:hypothetical protein